MANSITSNKTLIELVQKQKALECEHQQVINKLYELDASIAATKLEYARAYNQLSPLLNLPFEITTLIFQQACHSNADEHWNWHHQHAGSNVERVLVLVCHSWRTIAISCPDIWTTLICSSASIGHLKRYLERSGNQLLNLRFSISGGEELIWLAMIEQAAEQVSRWRRFSMLINAPNFSRCLDPLSAVRLSAPNLETFELCVNKSTTPDFARRRLFQGDAPKLGYLRIDSSSLKAFPRLSNLTTIQIEDCRGDTAKFSLSEFLNLLNSPTLVNFSVSGDPFLQPDPGFVAPPVLARSLKNFRLAGSNVVARHIWSYLQAPQLDLLIIKGVKVDATWIFPPDPNAILDKTASMIFPNLRLLALINCDVLSMTSLLALAHATSGVKHLHVYHGLIASNVGDDAFVVMAKTSPSMIFWPHLNTLTYLTEVDDNKHPIQRFVEALEYRSTTLKRHCTLRLSHNADNWKRRHTEYWKRLEEGGFYEKFRDRKSERDSLPWPLRAQNYQHFSGDSEDPFRFMTYSGRCT